MWLVTAAPTVVINDAEATVLTGSVSGRYESSENSDDEGETHRS